MSDVTISDVKHAALEILSRRDHAVNEIKAKLLKKFDVPFADRDNYIDQVLEELKQLNYLNDQRFAHLYCSYRSKKGFGPNRITQELHQKLSSIDNAQSVISIALMGPDAPDWYALAHTTYLKKFKIPPQSIKDQQKRKQFLYYRGFNQEEIDYALGCIRDID